ncbi:Translation initiation factor eIF3-like domain-containing protein [Monocercomonoides exilis]|uniref:Translation initiation factor eIF3-like domain-containing protein n=1 Tax=Monocercomonoides exilis TaxID=2049356 RepID=UPI003559FB10|nr:Translation initiation factor eIF3-like domain-containing protein [Monocercomonoides exilis]|eukprot:MONOS_6065.1-p1 / transcript=MONOS_6065.1 / gene=MONOS_6065 / organism=Monocercomonoides_exilis_PA203 / gene_product=Translation initiation factor eIF3-like domain-containing protein / transcript_product=Translation initiation factor eIF3-like domain-containing protein / location=Mono_scaffold00186:22480-23265(+) / protein_length=185 / sequence_SO=supercontig / SO=protein_coding / is_pseudo=false
MSDDFEDWEKELEEELEEKPSEKQVKQTTSSQKEASSENKSDSDLKKKDSSTASSSQKSDSKVAEFDPFAPSDEAEEKPEETNLETSVPTTPSQFADYAAKLTSKLLLFKKNPEFINFFKQIGRGVSQELKIEQIKEIGDMFHAVANEKLKQQQNTKRKKGGKVSLAKERSNIYPEDLDLDDLM